MRRFTVAALAICILLTGIMSAPTVYAAARTTRANQSFWVTALKDGSISEVTPTSAHHQASMVYYRIPNQYNGMAQVHYFLVHGSYAPDGKWHYRFTVHMSLGVRAESVEIGQNTKAHVEVIAVGIQPNVAPQPLPNTNTSTADLASVVYDPYNLQLVQVFDYLTYYWNGTCVTGIYAHFPATRLYPDGWYTVSESPSDGNGCGGGYAYTDGWYANFVFCGSLTEVHFSPQSEGLYNGSRYYNADYSATGACAGLLHWGQHWNA